MKTLHASFPRTAANMIIWLLITAVGGYFSQGYSEGRWWSTGYMLSLSLPFAIMIVAVWLMFVPRRFEYDERTLVIHFWFRGKQTRTWQELTYYSGGFGMDMVQFNSDQAFQIFSSAYPREEWRGFRDFLRTTYPDRKATGWLGPFGFKWGGRKAGKADANKGGYGGD